MRTAIYIYAQDPESRIELAVGSDAQVKKYEAGKPETSVESNQGTCMLTGGIYKVISDHPPKIQQMSGTPVDYDMIAVTNDKDPWPDPPARFRAVFSSVSLAVLRDFLPSASSAFGTNAKPPM